MNFVLVAHPVVDQYLIPGEAKLPKHFYMSVNYRTATSDYTPSLRFS